MTITTTASVKVGLGNGVATIFPTAFEVTAASHITVYQRNATTKVVTKTYASSEFTVTDLNTNSATVTFNVAPASGTEVVIVRVLPLTQDLDIVNQGGFFPETVEQQLDLTVMGIQQLQERSVRSLIQPYGESEMLLDAASVRAGKFFAFDAEGDFSGASGTGNDTALRTDLAASGGSALVGFIQSGAGAVVLSEQSILRLASFTPEQYGAVGDGVTDDTTAVQNAIDRAQAIGGRVVLTNIYLVSALTVTGSGIAITGPGTLKKKAGVDGRVLYVTGDRNYFGHFTIDGSAAAPTPGSTNDTFRIQGGNRNYLDRITISASKGSGIRIDAGSDNYVVGCESLSAYHNNLLICNPGADRNRVIGGRFDTTTAQNNIYLTANDGGAAGPTAFIYDNVMIGVSTSGAFDTGIEIGSHCVRTVLDDFTIGSSGNPGLLIRDAIDTNIGAGIIRTPALANQNANYDGISIITLGETAAWDTRTVIGNVIIRGAVNRSGIYIGQSGVTVDGVDIFDDITSVNATTGVGLAGYGITMAGTLSNITVRNSKVRRFERGIDLNQDASAVTRNYVELSGNTIEETNDAINGFNVTFESCVIHNNRIRRVVANALELSSATYAGELHYVDNITDLTGYSSASPVEFNPASAERAGLLTEYRSRYLLIPENQNTAVVLATGDQPSWGTLVLRFLDNSEVATFALGGRSGIGTATTSKLIGTTNLLDSTGSGGASGWSVYYDGSNNLILERRGANTGSGARYFKAVVRSEG